jgi:hypothetical protein
MDFCEKHSNDCAQMAAEFTDAERRRAWLQLAKEWVELAEQVALTRGKFRHDRNVSQSDR